MVSSANNDRWKVANQPHQFKHRDVVRAFKAASAAGVSNPSVQVRCPNGTVITIDSKPDAVTAVIPKPGKAPSSRSSRTSVGSRK
jgi:hypothetical protein